MKAADKQLLTAIQNGNLIAAKAAIAKGANPSIIVKERGKITNTAISMACVNQSPDVVEYLIEQGADINQADSRGQTPLMKSLLMGNKDACFKLLLSHGADVTVRNTFGDTIFDVVEKKGYSELLAILLEKHARPELATEEEKSKVVAEAEIAQVPAEILESVEPQEALKTSDTSEESVSGKDEQLIPVAETSDVEKTTVEEVGKTLFDVPAEAANDEINLAEVEKEVSAEVEPSIENVGPVAEEQPEPEPEAKEVDQVIADEQPDVAKEEDQIQPEAEVSKEFLKTVSWQAQGIRIAPASYKGPLPKKVEEEHVPHEPIDPNKALIPKSKKNKVRKFFRSFFELFMLRRNRKPMAVRNKKKEDENPPEI